MKFIHLGNSFYGIRQPETGNEISPGEADICIIPALGFNSRGFRIGRGSGYYDRSLAKVAPEKIVGLTYEDVFPVDFTQDKHDIFAGTVISEKRIRHFK